MTTIPTDVSRPASSVSTGGAAPSGKIGIDESKLESSPIGGSAATIKVNMTLIEIIKFEHEAVKSLYDEYMTATSGEAKEAKGFLIMNQLVQHSGKEEAVLYPLIRQKLEDGNALADRSKVEHQKITDDLYALDQLTWSSNPAEFDRLVRLTMQDTMTHVTEEEQEVLPKLQAKCSQQELMELGDKFQRQIVTTRPHPAAPREGVPAQIAQMASKPLDAARDAARFDEKTKAAAEK